MRVNSFGKYEGRRPASACTQCRSPTNAASVVPPKSRETQTNSPLFAENPADLPSNTLIFIQGSRPKNCFVQHPQAMKVRQIISIIERDGWHRVAAKAGHRQYKHPLKKGRVTISGQTNDDVHPKTLNSVLRQAGLK